MSQASRPESPFRWSGSLKESKIAQLYERCQRLRLTGNMQLINGAQTIDLVWIGGEPIENEGEAGTRSLPLWNDGSFIVEQRIPDWKGRLTGGTELSGSLRAGQIQAIYKLCADNQLSADVELQRTSGEAAQVRFTLGKAEQATIAGQTESALTALSKLSSWAEGTFRIALRPVFGDEKAAEAPVFGKKDSGSQFDLTGAVDASQDSNWQAVAAVPKQPSPAPRPVPAPAPAPVSNSNPPRAPAPAAAASSAPSGPTPAPRSAASPSASSSGGPAIPPRLASTLVNLPGKDAAAAGASTSQTLPTQPMSVVTKQQLQQAKKASTTKKALLLGSVAVLILCAAILGTLLFLR